MVLGNFNLLEIIRFAGAEVPGKTLMLNVLWLFPSTIFLIFRSQAALQVEIVALRHQIGVLRRSAKKRPKLTAADRLFWAWLPAESQRRAPVQLRSSGSEDSARMGASGDTQNRPSVDT